MTHANTHLHLLDQFKGETDLNPAVQFDHIDLSPPLVLAAALMYMMASDGEIKDSESSQLQSVLGGNDELLACAASYVQSVPIDTFLSEAADSLSGLDKLCILTNVCDSFLADGKADAAELALFTRICEAFGFDEVAFEPYLKTIQLKNDKSAMGRYNLAAAVSPQGAVSNHLALAACIVYMMASDGNIGTEEIGRLQAAIGEFPGLQSTALKYVVKVKSAQFLKDVVPSLNANIKLLILTNVCDTLLSDGIVEPAEKKLFVSMLTAFGYSEKTFRTYYETLHIKNVKSFDLADFADSAAAQVFRSANYKDSQAAFNAAHAGEGEHIGIVIHRTMEDNIASVSQNAGGKDNIHAMTDNANNLQNIQHVQAGQHEENIQYVDSSLNLSENIQTIDSADQVLATNIQHLPSASSLANPLSAMQWDVVQGEDGIRSSQSVSGVDPALSTGADAGMGLESASGKGGLTTMAQGEVSFRDRAMQNGQALTQLDRTQAHIDAQTLKTRLQALKLRNTEVENKLKQLRTGQATGFSAPVDHATNVAAEAPIATPPSISMLQRLSQAVAQGVGLLSKPRTSPSVYADAALT